MNSLNHQNALKEIKMANNFENAVSHKLHMSQEKAAVCGTPPHPPPFPEKKGHASLKIFAANIFSLLRIILNQTLKKGICLRSVN